MGWSGTSWRPPSASSKDGQRGRRRPRSRSLLARGPAPRPEPRREVGAVCGPAVRGRSAGSERGRARGAGSGAGRWQGGRAREEHRQWPRGRLAGPNALRGCCLRRPSHTCTERQAEGRGHRAHGRHAAPSSPAPLLAPGRGGLRAGTWARAQARDAQRAETPAAGAGEGARAAGALPGRLPFSPSLNERAQDFPFPRPLLVLLYFHHPFLGISM